MVTVFTPTYNRAYIIDKLYKSLLAQTDKNFEWVVVDDGSTDNTEKYFKEILEQNSPFSITYVRQSNGGKHRAINRGVQLARGELFFIVDSDDYLLEDAIEKLIQWCNGLDNSKKWAGVSGAMGYSSERCVGGVFDGAQYIDAKNSQRSKYNLYGDKAEAYFTEILKKYPFPEFDGENFITEEVVWNAIALDGYYLRWYKDIIYICDYLEDGLTKSGNEKNIKNPQGVLYWAKLQMRVFSNNTKKKLRAVNTYYESVQNKKSIKEAASDLGVSKTYVRLAKFVARIYRLLNKSRG